MTEDNKQNQSNLIEQARALLSPYIDDEVSESERALVETMLAQSPNLRIELESLRQTIQLMRDLPRMPAPRPFTLTEADVGLAPPEKRSPFYTWFKPLMGAMAALAAIFVVVLLVNQGTQTTQPTESVAMLEQSAQVAITATPEQPVVLFETPTIVSSETVENALSDDTAPVPEAQENSQFADEGMAVPLAPALSAEAAVGGGAVEAPAGVPIADTMSITMDGDEAAAQEMSLEVDMTENEDASNFARTLPEATTPNTLTEMPAAPAPKEADVTLTSTVQLSYQTTATLTASVTEADSSTDTPQATQAPPQITRNQMRFWLIAPAVGLIVGMLAIIYGVFIWKAKGHD